MTENIMMALSFGFIGRLYAKSRTSSSTWICIERLEDPVMKRSHLWVTYEMAVVSHDRKIKTFLEFVHPHVIAVCVIAGDLLVIWPLKLMELQLRLTDSDVIMGEKVREQSHDLVVEGPIASGLL